MNLHRPGPEGPPEAPLRLLLVGGSGFVGSVVAARLEEAGHDLTVCDDLSTGNAWAIPPGARFIPGDFSEPASLDRVMRGGYDAVLYLAESPPLEAAGAPVAYLRSNLGRLLNLLEAMLANGVRRLVHSSTAAVYGAPGASPVQESTAVRPGDPFGAWNAAVEQAIAFQTAARGLHAVSLRHFSVAGASGELGEWHHPETHLIPVVLRVAAGLCPAVQINGVDYPTPDGTAVRDYVHVDDVARAHLLALGASAEPGHALYNVGTGIGTSVREVISIARSVTGRTIPTVDAPRRPGDPDVLVASAVSVAEGLGWVAQRSIEEAIVDAWSWTRDRIGLRALPT
jgi:UDP-glucose 4-epimerase